MINMCYYCLDNPMAEEPGGATVHRVTKSWTWLKRLSTPKSISHCVMLCPFLKWTEHLGEWHWNMYNIMEETNRQSRLDAGYRMCGAGALGWPREMVQGGRWEGGSGLRTHVHLWWIHVDVWQNQYSIVKQNKVKKKKTELKNCWSLCR